MYLACYRYSNEELMPLCCPNAGGWKGNGICLVGHFWKTGEGSQCFQIPHLWVTQFFNRLYFHLSVSRFSAMGIWESFKVTGIFKSRR